MVNERASFPSKRECTKGEKEAMLSKFEKKYEARQADNHSYHHK